MTSNFFDKEFEEERPNLAEFGIQPCGTKSPLCLSDLRNKVAHSSSITPSHLFHNEADHEVPGQFSQYLREYQKQGIKFMYSCLRANRGAILGDDMGLGKTIQVIGLLTALMGKTGQRSKDFRKRYSRNTEKTCNEPGCSGFLCFLIVCPASVIYNWDDELERWGYFRVAMYHRNQRASTLQHVKSGHIEIVLTSFETAREHIDSLNQVDWSIVVVDEVHRLKDPKARLTQSLKRLRCLFRLGLTGTAVQNNLKELWSILDWANPGCLGSEKEFSRKIARPIERGQKQQATKRELAESYKKRKDLVSVWKQFLIRRTKKLISNQLPSKTDQVVYCRMSQFQKLIYEGMYKIPELQEILLSFDPCPCGENKTRGGCCYKTEDRVNRHRLAFTYMHLFLKVANHPALLLPSPTSSKIQAEMAKKICRIVFANEPLFLRLLETRLYRSLAKPKYCGKMEVLVEMLQVLKAESSKVLLFSYSTRVLDLLESFMQKQRAYRVGQSRDVRVFRLISSGCIEENVYLRQVYKQQLNHMTVESTNVKRYFQGIQGNHMERGELFGLRNMLSYHPEGSCLTKDILERNLALEEKVTRDESLKRKLGEASNAEILLKKKSGIANLMVGEYVPLSSTTGDEVTDNADIDADPENEDVIQSDNSEDESDSAAEDISVVESDEDRRVLIGEEESEEEAFGLASQFHFDVDNEISGAEMESNKSKKRIQFNAVIVNSCTDDDSSRQKNRDVNYKNINSVKCNIGETEDSENKESTCKDYFQHKDQNGEEIEDFEGEGKDAGMQKKNMNDIFKSGKILHTHANETVVGGSRAEDYMTKCAVRDVFELMKATQEPAHWCHPPSHASKMKESYYKSPIQQSHTSLKSPAISPPPVKVPLNSNTKKPSVPLAVNCEQIIVLQSHTVLYGQTPKGLRRDQFMNMAETKGFAPLDFAKQVLEMSIQEKFSFLKEYYSSLNTSHEAVFPKVLEKSSSHVKDESKTDTRYVDKNKTGKKKSVKVVSACNNDLSSEEDGYQEQSEISNDLSLEKDTSNKGKKVNSRRPKDEYVKKMSLINRKRKNKKSHFDNTAYLSRTFKNSNDGSKRKTHVLSSSESGDDINVHTLKKIQNSGKDGEGSKCAHPLPLVMCVEESEDSDESDMELLKARNFRKLDNRKCSQTDEPMNYVDKAKMTETRRAISSYRHSENPDYNVFIAALLSDDENYTNTEEFNMKEDLSNISQVKEMTGHCFTMGTSHKQTLDTKVTEQSQRKVSRHEDTTEREAHEKHNKAVDPDINYVLDGLFSDTHEKMGSSPDKELRHHEVNIRSSAPCSTRMLHIETHRTGCIFDELFGAVKSKTSVSICGDGNNETTDFGKQTNQNTCSMEEKYDGESSPCRCYFKCDGICKNKIVSSKSRKDASSLHKIW
ncbi:uncharacterized protein LOC143039912 isoform X2 [Oratosquilla oratoria]|uniref:uncharacterized protein LOC143039912 isoform X2 n=1 Tax=Oratosquilla oratoria TaxID=337810 RepID=UPI003F75A364